MKVCEFPMLTTKTVLIISAKKAQQPQIHAKIYEIYLYIHTCLKKIDWGFIFFFMT